MFVGILTAPFVDEPLETVMRFSAENGFGGIEVAAGYGSKHLDLSEPATWKQAGELATRYSIPFTSIAAYTNNTDGDLDKRARANEVVKRAIDAANELGVEVVCTLAGLPPTGKSKIKTIEEDCVAVFPPLLDYATSKGVKIALENWYATNIQGMDHWERLFTLVPHENFGLNYDPSHLLWMDIDYINPLLYFRNRIFHTHAKDTEVLEHKRSWVGNQGSGWWRYVIPGLGRVRWGEYIGALRSIGYNGTLSIEHEDSAVGREEGFLIGKRYLSQFI